MQIWRGIDSISASLDGTVVTIGIFDGVHAGHRAVLAETVALARRHDVPAVVVTFDPHPAVVHNPDAVPELLTGETDRFALVAESGIDAVLVLAYDLAFAQQTPREFVERYFVDALSARAVVVGEDVRFGANNSGDRATLIELGEEFGFDVDIIGDIPVEGSNVRASSTLVRELLAAGDARAAARILGRPHKMHGVVVRGQARGRELGFPTANLAAAATGTIPGDGIYAGWVIVPGGDEVRMPAAISVGVNPTFEGVSRVVEAHVLGRLDLDLYDQAIIVEFVEQLRPMLKFDGVGELITQMNHDVDHAADVLGVPRPTNRIGWQGPTP